MVGKTDNCDNNAACTNIPGGYNCTCKSGFTDTYGDGSNCIGDTTLKQLLSSYIRQLIMVACPCINVIQDAILRCASKIFKSVGVILVFWES